MLLKGPVEGAAGFSRSVPESISIPLIAKGVPGVGNRNPGWGL